MVRCEALLNQDYTVPPAPKCLARSRFLPGDLTYQDIQWQPLLLTLAYAQAWQYWAEKVSLPTLDAYCPLAMSIVELKWWAEGHITFSKQDIFHNLGDTVPEARSQDTEAPPEGIIAPPTTADIGGVEPHPAKTHGADDTILASPGFIPNDEAWPAEPTTFPAETNLPVSVEIPQGVTWQPKLTLMPWEIWRPFGPLALPWWRTGLFPPPDWGTSWPALPHLPTR